MSKYMGQIMAECDCQHKACEVRGYCMAARIKELESDLSFMKACHGELAHQYNGLEEKLGMAVEALREIAADASVEVKTKKHGGIKFKWMYSTWRKIAVKRIDIARAMLAEIDICPSCREPLSLPSVAKGATEALLAEKKHE